MAKEKYTKHPSIVVIGGEPKLRVFEDFFIEEELPKWKKIEIKLKEQGKSTAPDSYNTTSEGASMNLGVNDLRSDEWLLRNAKYDRSGYLDHRRRDANGGNKSPLFALIFEKIRERFGRGTEIEDTFNGVKTAIAYPTNESLLKSVALVDAVVAKSNAAGQYEIANRIKGVRKSLEAELVLAQNNMLRYITEEQVIEFMLKSERGVRMEYLRYYNEILPSQVMAQKIAVDALLAFDNYCVLYYDNGTKKFSLIKEAISDRERERRRDPILFGMIHGSRKLYYITDWVTKDDNLTLEKFQQAIGEKALDFSTEEIADTKYTSVRILDEMLNHITIDIDKEAEAGRLLTEANFDQFVLTGNVAHSMRNLVPELNAALGKEAKTDAPDKPEQTEKPVKPQETPPEEKK